jgi:hypothetical protein
MERGAVSSAILVLALVSIVGVLAAVTLNAWQPSGLVMQNQNVYVTEDASQVGMQCNNQQNLAYFLGYTGVYAVFCCTEDMNGANDCKYPHQIMIKRSY